ncbi:uncharacterized protein LOC132543435 [Ylistrum balloti]|uniref:uncharacterized protein LOC132543435 n=1 Tax=Ylistrum balloti TaxID=509963 RepID=UPI002905895D|nr:uncharacterized protein LOC132543435 [Ylistrum balloti]
MSRCALKLPLTNAERQRRWREKQKAKNEEDFFKKEAKRKKEKYIPVECLGANALKKRREDGRKRSKRSYDKLKTQENVKTHLQERMTKANKRLQKRLERIKKKFVDSSDSHDDSDYVDSINENNSVDITMTPNSKTKHEMKLLNLEKITNGKRQTTVRRKLSFIRKKFLLANTMASEIKESVTGKKKKINSAKKSWKGITGKYRCTAIMGKALGVSRRKVRVLGTARKTSTGTK